MLHCWASFPSGTEIVMTRYSAVCLAFKQNEMRNDPLIATLGAAIGLTSEEINNPFC